MNNSALTLEQAIKVDQILEKIMAKAPLDKQQANFRNNLEKDPAGRLVKILAASAQGVSSGNMDYFSIIFILAERDRSGKLPKYTAVDATRALGKNNVSIARVCHSLAEKGLLDIIKSGFGGKGTQYVPSRAGYAVLRLIEKNSHLL